MGLCRWLGQLTGKIKVFNHTDSKTEKKSDFQYFFQRPHTTTQFSGGAIGRKHIEISLLIKQYSLLYDM